MPPTPKDIASMTKGTLEHQRIYQEGVDEGRSRTRKEVLDFLHKAYVNPQAPERDSPEAKAILKVTSDLSKFLKPIRDR